VDAMTTLRSLLRQAERDRTALEHELRLRLGEDFLDFADCWSTNQKKVLTSACRFLFAFGGTGAGKTTLGSWWTRAILASYNPITGQITEKPQPINVYCVGNTIEKVKGVMMPALRRWLPDAEIVHEDRESNIWTLTEGRRVFWKTGKQDVTTFTGDEIDGCWVDEELSDRPHFDEILSRLTRRMGIFLNTLTPALGTLWLHNWVFSPDEYPMEEKEIVRIPMDENPYYHNCDVCLTPKAWHDRGHKKSCAKFRNVSGRKKLEFAKKAFKGIIYKIRFEGHYLLMAGRSVINPAAREKMAAEHERHPVLGYLNSALGFVHCEDHDDPRAWLRIQVGKNARSGELELLVPRPGHNYVMGVDVGGGNPTGDYHAAVVIDQESGEQVALAHTRNVEPRDFGAFVTQLGKFYNDAFTIVEINNHGLAVTDRMIELGYAALYRRQRLDSTTKVVLPRMGFFTDVKTKPAAVDLMTDFFQNRWKIHDPIILAEAFHYTWLRDARHGSHGVSNSNPDGHDDTMSCLFLCAVALKQMGWGHVSPGEQVEREMKPTIADVMIEDVAGRALTEEEVLAGAAEQDEPGQIRDVFDEGVSPLA
jgi:hypothetical protein